MSHKPLINPLSGQTGARIFDIAATIFFWIAVLSVLNYMFLNLYPLTRPDSPAQALRIDFVAFWAAAKLALAGQPMAAFDPEALYAVSGLPAGDQPNNLLWLYPASFLVALMPLGALPFPFALTAFVATSATAFALAVRSPASVLPGLWRLMLFSPMVFIGCLAIGQTSVLWTAGLVAGLWAMRGGNAVAAGLAIALLTMKPQLGLLIPIALIAARQWAVIGWATGFTLLLAGIATALIGLDYWGYFLDAIGDVVGRVADGTMSTHLMSSFYGFMRALGLGHGAAIAPQFALTAGLISIIAWIWSRPGLGYDLKCATLCASIPLATPYAYYYEMTIMLAAGLFLIRDGFGQHLAAKAWLLVLWFGPVPAIQFKESLNIALYTPPILLATVAICLVRARRKLSAMDENGPSKAQRPTES